MTTRLLTLFLTLLSFSPFAFGQMSIFQAAKEGNVLDVQQAISGGQNVNATDEYEQTPIMYAAGANTPEVVQFLIDSGADIDAVSNTKWTALHFAVRDNTDPQVTQVLLDAGADTTLGTDEDMMASQIARSVNPGAWEVFERYLQQKLEGNPLMGYTYSFYYSPFCQLYQCIFVEKIEEDLVGFKMERYFYSIPIQAIMV
jgi:ankyrin repeat protein